MANIKSAKKRISVIAKKTMRNKIIKTNVKTNIKKVINAVNHSNKQDANEALKLAIKSINKACSKGIFHKNNASRKISRLTKLVNKVS